MLFLRMVLSSRRNDCKKKKKKKKKNKKQTGNNPRMRKRSLSPVLNAVPLLNKGWCKISAPRTLILRGDMKFRLKPENSQSSIMGSARARPRKSKEDEDEGVKLLGFSDVRDVVASVLKERCDECAVAKKEQSNRMTLLADLRVGGL